MGYIYIMENPIFNNYIKIGYADNVKARLNTLNTAVPEPYHVYAIYKTSIAKTTPTTVTVFLFCMNFLNPIAILFTFSHPLYQLFRQILAFICINIFHFYFWIL